MDEVERLRRELDELRDNVIASVDWDCRMVLMSYDDYGSYRDWMIAKRGMLLNAFMKKCAEAMKGTPYELRRAPCPLCGAVPQSQNPDESVGFTLPEGLSRHLDGWGRMKRCYVAEVAEAIARDYFARREDGCGPRIN